MKNVLVATPTRPGSTLFIHSACSEICPPPCPIDLSTEAINNIPKVEAQLIIAIDMAVAISDTFTIKVNPCLSAIFPTNSRRTNNTMAPTEKNQPIFAIYLYFCHQLSSQKKIIQYDCQRKTYHQRQHKQYLLSQ